MIPTENKYFWILQIFGWGAVASTNFLIQSFADFPMKLLLFNSLAPFSIGIFVTSVYRFLIYKRKWQHLSFYKILGLTLVSSAILTGAFMIPITVIFNFLFSDNLSIIEFLSNGFILGIAMLAWCVIYFSIHYFNSWYQAEVDKWKMVADMKEAQLGSLKSQINPHFIFNAINNIRSLILEDKEKARDMLLNFSDLFRYSLLQTDKAKVTIRQELEMVNQYFELLSIQYEDKLKYNITIDDTLKEIEVPPMMLQLLVENAVKHGISQFKEGGSILINIEKESNHVNIKVKNTGSLNISSRLGDKLGVGLENIIKRLDILYNGNAKLDLREESNFVQAEILIPIT